MNEMRTKYRFLFAGGGTGGHLFPAIAVADKIKSLIPEAEIMFVGTKSRIEGRIVPQLGYNFRPIWIKGFPRKFSAANLLFPLKLLVSVIQSVVINMKFKPKVAIGSGGYVSGPAIFGANVMGAKIILLEQNSYPGITTRLLEKYAKEIHLSFEDSKKYFRVKENLKVTGNPVRENLIRIDREDALKEFELSASKKTLLILGGSLGARSINEAVASTVKEFVVKGLQVIWQTGNSGYKLYKKFNSESVKVFPFIDEMNFAYSACDLLIARAGGLTIAEFLKLGIPCMLIPSPNVAENHQYFNAKSLIEQKAAILIEDKDIKDGFFNEVNNLIGNENLLSELRKNCLKIAKPNAASVIAESAIKYAEAI